MNRGRKTLVNILKYILLVFAAFVALVPIVSCVITAFKTVEEYQTSSTVPFHRIYPGSIR